MKKGGRGGGVGDVADYGNASGRKNFMFECRAPLLHT
jgi:hypothetical protein